MKSIKFFPAIITAGILLLVYTACSKSSSSYGGGGGGGGTTANTIKIQSMSFSPGSYSVKVGTVIKWQNDDAVSHSATSDNGTSFDLTIAAGGSATFTCNVAGTFPYHCKFHGGMTATLTVTP